MTEVSLLLCAPSATCVPTQAAGRLAVSMVDMCLLPAAMLRLWPSRRASVSAVHPRCVQRLRSHRGDSSIARDVPFAAPYDSPHHGDLAVLAPDQENDTP